MNRDDLLKRCVDRRVAHETSVVAVSHLFYVYLLSALKKGQRVEVPNFGTFGTHVVGVKRQRRMPFFEVENELADKVNERYRSLKTLLVGTYELHPAAAETEYAGKEGSYDPFAERLGKEIVVDTGLEISADEYRKQQLIVPTEPPAVKPSPQAVVPPKQEEAQKFEMQAEPPPKERKLMPKLNLRGEGTEGEPTPPQTPETEPFKPSEPPPTLRDFNASRGPSPLLQIILGLLILAIITFALNYFGIIQLWGTRAPVQSTDETLPPVVQPAPQSEESTTQPETSGQQQLEPTPTPTEKPSEEAVKPPSATEQKKPTETPAITTPPTGTGNFTVQVSSWTRQRDADRVVERLKNAGFTPYVVEANVKGRQWYRVRVGRYGTSAEARAAADQLRSVNENGVWVTRVD